jgi:hypothetical protein
LSSGKKGEREQKIHMLGPLAELASDLNSNNIEKPDIRSADNNNLLTDCKKHKQTCKSKEDHT